MTADFSPLPTVQQEAAKRAVQGEGAWTPAAPTNEQRLAHGESLDRGQLEARDVRSDECGQGGVCAPAPSLKEMIGLAKAVQTVTADGAPADAPIENQELTAGAAAANTTVSPDIQRAASSALSLVAAKSNKAELANIFETLACTLRGDDQLASVSYAEHNAQVAELKRLLMEAQETIISLLNDRVLDRAKLARLETEARFYPDLQAQAHRAANLVSQTLEMQNQLETVRQEVERLRSAYVRQTPAGESWFARLFRRNAPDA